MITTIEISADSVDHARQAAIEQARAQGYTRIEAVFTTPIGDRLFRVQMTVSRPTAGKPTGERNVHQGEKGTGWIAPAHTYHSRLPLGR
ncbi:MAG: hypothetical protein IPG68_16165 [Micrococcales bacterium]|nr:hypothetical protein [Micrococcales bacterium]